MATRGYFDLVAATPQCELESTQHLVNQVYNFVAKMHEMMSTTKAQMVSTPVPNRELLLMHLDNLNETFLQQSGAMRKDMVSAAPMPPVSSNHPNKTCYNEAMVAYKIVASEYSQVVSWALATIESLGEIICKDLADLKTAIAAKIVQ